MVKKAVIIFSAIVLLGCNFVKSNNRAQSGEKPNRIEYLGLPSDSIFVDSLLSIVHNDNLPKEQRLFQIAESFLDKPYGVRTLEIADSEHLVVNTRAVDCLTFVENVLALYRVSLEDKPSFNKYLKELMFIRYRGGEMTDYTSRLHYYSDWMTDNQQKGVLRLITGELGGDKFIPQVGFMSENPDKYKALKNHPEFVRVMAEHEQRINQMEYAFIPKLEIPRIQSEIKTGDIIGITTNIKGLDISHTGIAVNIDDTLYFLHASSSNRKVMQTEIPFITYTSDIDNQTGIVVLRIK